MSGMSPQHSVKDEQSDWFTEARDPAVTADIRAKTGICFAVQ